MEQFDSSVEESSKVSEQQQKNDEQQYYLNLKNFTLFYSAIWHYHYVHL